jgi:hypothetical protein
MEMFPEIKEAKVILDDLMHRGQAYYLRPDGSADLSSDSESDVYTKPTEPMAGEHEKTNAVDNMSEYESQLPPHDNECTARLLLRELSQRAFSMFSIRSNFPKLGAGGSAASRAIDSVATCLCTHSSGPLTSHHIRSLHRTASV